MFFRQNHTYPMFFPDTGIIMDETASKKACFAASGRIITGPDLPKNNQICENRIKHYRTPSYRELATSETEVDSIMKLFKEYLEESLTDFTKENIRTRFIGDFTPLSPEIRELMSKAEELTKNKTGLCLNIAINYGGREEIAHAARSIARDVAEGRLSPDDITQQDISERIYTAGQPDPDLILRPSGEYRTSNLYGNPHIRNMFYGYCGRISSLPTLTGLERVCPQKPALRATKLRIITAVIGITLLVTVPYCRRLPDDACPRYADWQWRDGTSNKEVDKPCWQHRFCIPPQHPFRVVDNLLPASIITLTYLLLTICIQIYRATACD